MRRVIFMLTVLLVVGFVSPAFGYWVWTPQTGKWINPKYAVKDTPEDQMEWAMSFYEANDHDRAIREFRKLVKYFPRSKQAAEAQYYVGRCYEALGYYYQAFEAYQKTLDEFPYTKRFNEIVAREYELGERFLEGQKHKYAGITLFPSYEKGAEIFKKVAENAPYGEIADKALYKAGECYKMVEMYDEATLVFIKLTEEYPDSELIEKAQFQIAYTSLKASAKPHYDQEATDKAIEEFNTFIAEHPGSELAKDAEDALKVLNEKKAEYNLEIAEFYDRQREYEAAEIYYQQIVDKYEGTSCYPIAQTRLKELEVALDEAWIEEEVTQERVKLAYKAKPSKLIQVPEAKPEKAAKLSPQIEETQPERAEGVRVAKLTPPAGVKEVEHLESAAETTKSAEPVAETTKPAEEPLDLARDPSSMGPEPAEGVKLARLAKPLPEEEIKRAVSKGLGLLTSLGWQNFADNGKVKLYTKGPVVFTHYPLDEPPRIVIDFVEPAYSNSPAVQKFENGLIESIRVAEAGFAAPDELGGDFYEVDFVVVQMRKLAPYSVSVGDGFIAVDVGSHVKVSVNVYSK